MTINMNTNSSGLNTIKQSLDLMGNLLSDDKSAREVELAFINRYYKAVHKASQSIFSDELLIGGQDSVSDELESQFVTDLKLINNPIFSKIARELEKNIPTTTTFGKFGA